MPPTDDRLGKYTQEELWIEFFEDLLEADPTALRMDGELDDDVVVESSDPEMQEIESRMARGESIEEILESWENEDTKAFWRARGEKPAKPVEPEAEIEDDYTKKDQPLRLTTGKARG